MRRGYWLKLRFSTGTVWRKVDRQFTLTVRKVQDDPEVWYWQAKCGTLIREGISKTRQAAQNSATRVVRRFWKGDIACRRN